MWNNSESEKLRAMLKFALKHADDVQNFKLEKLSEQESFSLSDLPLLHFALGFALGRGLCTEIGFAQVQELFTILHIEGY